MHADELPITGPCPIDLDAIGFDRSSKVSHCTHCEKSVTNLSSMTRDEAREFMREHDGKNLCVSYACDGNGRIRFRPEPALVPVARLRPRLAASLATRKPSRAAGFVAALGISTALAACTPHREPVMWQGKAPIRRSNVLDRELAEPNPGTTEVAPKGSALTPSSPTPAAAPPPASSRRP